MRFIQFPVAPPLLERQVFGALRSSPLMDRAAGYTGLAITPPNEFLADNPTMTVDGLRNLISGTGSYPYFAGDLVSLHYALTRIRATGDSSVSQMLKDIAGALARPTFVVRNNGHWLQIKGRVIEQIEAHLAEWGDTPQPPEFNLARNWRTTNTYSGHAMQPRYAWPQIMVANMYDRSLTAHRFAMKSLEV